MIPMRQGHEMIKKPIPKSSAQSSGWKSVNILESGEALVCLNDLDACVRIVVCPQYYLQNLPGSLQQCFTRETVASKLTQAAMRLPDGFSLVVWDAWRPLEVQRLLFERYKNELAQKNPPWTEDELIERTRKFVSLPSRDPKAPSPHATGGAVDLSILDAAGEDLAMGTPFDDFSPRASTRYYETLAEQGAHMSSDEQKYRDNRRLLYQVMIEAGFTNYAEEWWHYDFGNQLWARLSGCSAIYGLATPG
jgi:D-alanyl-D-alanine dipeptidase